MSPNRRDALQFVAGVGLAGLAGCLGRTGIADSTTTQDTTTATTTSARTTTTTEPTETETTTTSDTTDDTKTETLRIENRQSESHVISVEVLDAQDEPIVTGTYEVPGETGLTFDHEFDWGTYTVRGKRQGGDWQSVEWEPSSCASTPAPDGNMDAGVIVGEDGLVIKHNTCDFIKLSKMYVDNGYEPATEFRVEE